MDTKEEITNKLQSILQTFTDLQEKTTKTIQKYPDTSIDKVIGSNVETLHTLYPKLKLYLQILEKKNELLDKYKLQEEERKKQSILKLQLTDEIQTTIIDKQMKLIQLINEAQKFYTNNNKQDVYIQKNKKNTIIENSKSFIESINNAIYELLEINVVVNNKSMIIQSIFKDMPDIVKNTKENSILEVILKTILDGCQIIVKLYSLIQFFTDNKQPIPVKITNIYITLKSMISTYCDEKKYKYINDVVTDICNTTSDYKDDIKLDDKDEIDDLKNKKEQLKKNILYLQTRRDIIFQEYLRYSPNPLYIKKYQEIVKNIINYIITLNNIVDTKLLNFIYKDDLSIQILINTDYNNVIRSPLLQEILYEVLYTYMFIINIRSFIIKDILPNTNYKTILNDLIVQMNTIYNKINIYINRYCDKNQIKKIQSICKSSTPITSIKKGGRKKYTIKCKTSKKSNKTRKINNITKTRKYRKHNYTHKSKNKNYTRRKTHRKMK